VVDRSRELRAAYEYCEQLAKAHYENFPVASRLLPAKLRPHIAAIYAFARAADDFADEPGYQPGERMRLLRDWRAKLHPPSRHGASAGQVGSGDDAIFLALHDTIDRFSLPLQLFDDLLNAFVQDVGTTRYSTWADVVDYCRQSANPVGRLVLRLNGYHDERIDAASDAVCTALQLTNFWQDLAIDWSRGRLYVPEEIWRAQHAEVTSLDAQLMTPQWKAALADCSLRTRELFQRGRPVCDAVSGRLRYELRATWLGGMRILDRLDRAGYDVFRRRPKLGAPDALVIACETLLWRETPPSPTRS
jgi:hydroxysqualene synthase